MLMNKSEYIPRPSDTSNISLPEGMETLVEALARNVHEVWAAGRLENGWVLGEERNDALKQHPCLVPYEELSEEEKDYDRNTAVQTLKLIMSLGYQITR